MFQDIDLRELSELHAPERAFVSAYINGSEGLRTLEKRERRLRHLISDDPLESDHYDLSIERLHNVLDDNPIGENESICVFACGALDFAKGYRLHMDVENTLRLGTTPYIRPIAELQDEYENFIVVAADNRSTRIILVTSAVPEAERRVRGDIKQHVKKGGWSQQRYERRRDKELKHYAKEINERLEQMTRRRRLNRIILLGSGETLNELEKVLDPRMAEMVVGKKSVDVHEGEDALMEDAYELFFLEERAEERRLWESIKEEYYGHGLAAAGPEEVLEALQSGRVDTMAISRDASITGLRCGGCEYVFADPTERCPYCGSEDLVEIDLVNELTRLVETTSADVDFVDPVPGLSKVGHVAALLRY